MKSRTFFYLIILLAVTMILPIRSFFKNPTQSPKVKVVAVKPVIKEKVKVVTVKKKKQERLKELFPRLDSIYANKVLFKGPIEDSVSILSEIPQITNGYEVFYVKVDDELNSDSIKRYYITFEGENACTFSIKQNLKTGRIAWRNENYQITDSMDTEKVIFFLEKLDSFALTKK